MAEEKKIAADASAKDVKADSKKAAAEAPKKKNGFGTKFKNFFANIGKAFKNMYFELKKVTWPSKRKWLVYSGIVLVFMLCMAIVIGLFDMGSSALVRWLGTIA